MVFIKKKHQHRDHVLISTYKTRIMRPCFLIQLMRARTENHLNLSCGSASAEMDLHRHAKDMHGSSLDYHWCPIANYKLLHDFLVFEPVTKPQNEHYLSLETPGHLKKARKTLDPFEK